MKCKITDILVGAGIGWIVLCTALVTSYIFLFIIFGGKFSLEINFDSWNELMKTLKK